MPVLRGLQKERSRPQPDFADTDGDDSCDIYLICKEVQQVISTLNQRSTICIPSTICEAQCQTLKKIILGLDIDQLPLSSTLNSKGMYTYSQYKFLCTICQSQFKPVKLQEQELYFGRNVTFCHPL